MIARRSGRSAGIGGSLILIIFIILTITVFSVLTLVSSQNELGTVKKSAQISSDYYNAEKTAAIKTGIIKAAVSELTELREIATTAEKNGADATVSETEVIIKFKVKIDDNRSIETVLKADGSTVKIISKKTVSDNQIIIDDNMNFWDGVTPFN